MDWTCVDENTRDVLTEPPGYADSQDVESIIWMSEGRLSLEQWCLGTWLRRNGTFVLAG